MRSPCGGNSCLPTMGVPNSPALFTAKRFGLRGLCGDLNVVKPCHSVCLFMKLYLHLKKTVWLNASHEHGQTGPPDGPESGSGGSVSFVACARKDPGVGSGGAVAGVALGSSSYQV